MAESENGADARIGDTILEFREKFKDGGLLLEGKVIPKKPVRKMLWLFRQVKDTRSQKKIMYPMPEIIMAAFVAILAGADMFTDIYNFCDVNRKWLAKNFMIKSGIPSHDTFRRVLSLIDPQQLQKATVTFLMESVKIIKKACKIKEAPVRQLCVDGKTACGTGRLKGLAKEVKPLQTLHVYDRTDGICIVSTAISSKTNEIPVAQQILGTLDLRKSIVTFDAMNTQRKTIEVVVGQNGDYIGALKENQPGLLQETESFFTPARLARIEFGGKGFFETKEKLHNKIESRKYYLSTNVGWLVQLPDWAKLRSLVCYKLRTEDVNSGKVTEETRFYISSITDVELCAEGIRGQWAVEVFHWYLDTNYFEDDDGTVDKVAFQNKSLLRKMSLTLTKFIAPIKKVSVRSTRKIIGWNVDIIIQSFCILDEDSLIEALANVKV
jgi:predicted transposase YbfD/YdcC